MTYTRDDDKIMVAFGKRLKAARITAGYDEASTFADFLGLGDQAYRKYERGESMPPPAILERMTIEVGKSLDFLLFGRGSRGESVL